MRISPSGPQGVPEPYRQNGTGRATDRPAESGPAGNVAEADAVQLSPQAQLIQRLQRELGVAPARAARVAALKEAVDAGQYTVPADQVARRMLERGFGKS